MPKAKLTKRVVEALKPGDRDIILWDAELKGFGCKVTPRGKRVYFTYYRTRDGRQRRPTIGTHGTVTCEQARETAQRWLAQVASGGDPSGERQARKGAPTVADVAGRFLIEHAVPHKKPSSIAQDRRMLATRVLPALGKRKASEVTRADVLRLHHSLRDTPYEANRVLALLSKMMNLAEAWGVRAYGSNPVKHVKRYREHKRERFFTEPELARLGAVLAEAEATGIELPGVVAAIRLLALTGLRLGEVLGLQWECVDFEAGVLRLLDAKAGARAVPLGAQALALFAELPRVDGSPWVLHGGKPGGPLSASTLEGAWQRIRKRAALADCRAHDLRHTNATFAGQAGANAFLVRDKLGHKTLAMTGRYVERDDDPLRALSNKVEKRIAAAMSGHDADVVEMPGRKR